MLGYVALGACSVGNVLDYVSPVALSADPYFAQKSVVLAAAACVGARALYQFGGYSPEEAIGAADYFMKFEVDDATEAHEGYKPLGDRNFAKTPVTALPTWLFVAFSAFYTYVLVDFYGSYINVLTVVPIVIVLPWIVVAASQRRVWWFAFNVCVLVTMFFTYFPFMAMSTWPMFRPPPATSSRFRTTDA